MKTLFVILSLFILVSCSTPGVYNPAMKDDEVYVKIGSKTFQVHYIILSEHGQGMYILAPKDTAVEVSIEQVGFKNGKVETSVIKVE
jgi:hypothetical protein